MKILKTTYDLLLNKSPLVPPESGGILGGTNGIVTVCFFDNGVPSNDYDEYVPNVDVLNCKISEWKDNNVAFLGLFHTHFPCGTILSDCDKQYIRKILQHTPLHKLYFPIVIPKKKIYPYYAEKNNGKIFFSKENITIINI